MKQLLLDVKEESNKKIKTNGINDINLLRWKEYNNIITESLWIINKRNSSGSHSNWYWGNFIPQIPEQMILRFTKKNDWILDPFLGSGTTLIECKRLGRNGIGIELNKKIAEKASILINKQSYNYDTITKVISGDSIILDYEKILDELDINKVQLLIFHPPYHDIIKFSDDPNDLSNAPNLNKYLELFGTILDKTFSILEAERYLVLVIGDRRKKGELIPLSFYVMNEVLKRDYIIKNIIIKNINEGRGSKAKGLLRYRSLAAGIYTFNHEYIMLFKKR